MSLIDPEPTVATVYEFSVSREIRDPRWDAYLATTAGGSYTQTAMWAETKAFLGYEVVRVLTEYGGEIVGGAQMLIRRSSFLGAFAYVPCGPVIQRQHSKLAGDMIERLHQFSRAEGARVLVLQPPPETNDLDSELTNSEFRQTFLELAPTATVSIDLRCDLDDIMRKMRKTTRYDIRASERKGIVVREGTAVDLPVFYRLLCMTAERQKFTPYHEEYFKVMWNAFGSRGSTKMFLAELNGEPVSALLLIASGKTVTYWKGGWSGLNGNCFPNESLHWAAIKWAKSAGYASYDFGGINRSVAVKILSGSPLPCAGKGDVYSFKLGFGGQTMLLPMPYAYVYNPILRWAHSAVVPDLADSGLLRSALNWLR